MFSMPPATATLMLPSKISCAAETTACTPEPQTRLTVIAGVVTGSPACTAACRAGFILAPACTTLPMAIVSISSGRSPARLTAPAIATAPRLAAGTSLRLPPKVPMAVRTGSAKTTERCDVMTKPPEPKVDYCALPLRSSCLDLREAAIYKQFGSRDITGVVGCEKHHGFRDLIRRTERAEWNGVGNHLLTLLARFRGCQQIA